MCIGGSLIDTGKAVEGGESEPEFPHRMTDISTERASGMRTTSQVWQQYDGKRCHLSSALRMIFCLKYTLPDRHGSGKPIRLESF